MATDRADQARNSGSRLRSGCDAPPAPLGAPSLTPDVQPRSARATRRRRPVDVLLLERTPDSQPGDQPASAANPWLPPTRSRPATGHRPRRGQCHRRVHGSRGAPRHIQDGPGKLPERAAPWPVDWGTTCRPAERAAPSVATAWPTLPARTTATGSWSMSGSRAGAARPTLVPPDARDDRRATPRSSTGEVRVKLLVMLPCVGAFCTARVAGLHPLALCRPHRWVSAKRSSPGGNGSVLPSARRDLVWDPQPPTTSPKRA